MRRRCSEFGCEDPVWPQAKFRQRVCRFHDTLEAVYELQAKRWDPDVKADRERVKFLQDYIDAWVRSMTPSMSGGES